MAIGRHVSSFLVVRAWSLREDADRFTRHEASLMPVAQRMRLVGGSQSTRSRFQGGTSHEGLGDGWFIVAIGTWQRLARYPILGDGKGDNQNTAVPFTRGTYVQCIDANQARCQCTDCWSVTKHVTVSPGGLLRADAAVAQRFGRISLQTPWRWRWIALSLGAEWCILDILDGDII